MFIYTDDKKYAEKIIPEVKYWKDLDLKKISTSNGIVQKILTSKNIYFSEVKFSSSWKYIFITKHSDQSQFDLLYNLSKINFELPDGILCLADSGSKFHGYRDRQWNAQSGNLHLSVFKKPNKSVEKFHIGFTILAAISVVQTLDVVPGMNLKASIKWVNDILIDGSKIAGVITQTQSQKDVVTAVILGIGLNIENAPNKSIDSFVGNTTCVYEHSNINQIYFSDILNTLIEKLQNNYQLLLEGNYQKLLKIYKQRSIILNRVVEIYSDSRNGNNSLIASGKVINIGDELELYIDGIDNPIRQGRLKLL